MASIYSSIGFHRKAAMFTLYAARHANKLTEEHAKELKLAKLNTRHLIHKVNRKLFWVCKHFEFILLNDFRLTNC
jgi:hypothetical protein